MSIHPSTTRSLARKALLGGAAAGMLVLGTVAPAMAAPGDTAVGSTTGNVAVTTSISMSGLTPSFTLTGVPRATVTGIGAVTLNVETNNLAGYAVTVQSASGTMTPAVSNGDSIPIGALTVRETGTTNYTPLSSTGTVTVHTQALRSSEGGDNLSNDYQVLIPFVNEATYSATLNYVATTL